MLAYNSKVDSINWTFCCIEQKKKEALEIINTGGNARFIPIGGGLAELSQMNEIREITEGNKETIRAQEKIKNDLYGSKKAITDNQ